MTETYKDWQTAGQKSFDMQRRPRYAAQYRGTRGESRSFAVVLYARCTESYIYIGLHGKMERKN